MVLLFIIIASINPLEFESYLLHQAGTVIMLIALIVTMKKIGIDFFSFCLYLTFLFIHIIGAHYLYSYVPYNQWLLDLFAFDLNQSMGWSRNMYDRLVHFAYGVLLYPFFYRCFQVWIPSAKPFTLFLLVLQFVMASSMVYELLEWGLSIGLSPKMLKIIMGNKAICGMHIKICSWQPSVHYLWASGIIIKCQIPMQKHQHKYLFVESTQ